MCKLATLWETEQALLDVIEVLRYLFLGQIYQARSNSTQEVAAALCPEFRQYCLEMCSHWTSCKWSMCIWCTHGWPRSQADIKSSHTNTKGQHHLALNSSWGEREYGTPPCDAPWAQGSDLCLRLVCGVSH